MVAFRADKTLLASVSEFFIREAAAAISGVGFVPDGTRVDLLRILDSGDQVEVLGGTTTSAGRYSIDLRPLGLTTSSDLVVQISSSSSGARLRSFVTSEHVNIDPVSEATVRLVLGKVAATQSGSLKNFTVRELDDLQACVFLVLGMQGLAAGLDIETTVAAFKNAAGADSGVAAFLNAAAAEGQADGPGDVGNYFPLSPGMTLNYSGSAQPPSSSYDNTASYGGTASIGGLPAVILKETNPQNGGPLSTYFHKSGAAVINLGNDDPGDIITAQVAPYREVPLPLKVGASFQQIKRTSLNWGDDLDGDGVGEKFDMDSKVTVPALEKVDTNAGVFSNAVKVVTIVTFTITLSKTRSVIGAIVTNTSWYAPGVGKVKSIDVFQAPALAPSSTVAESVGRFDVKGESGSTTTRILDLPAKNFVYDPVRKLIYASVPSSASSLANTITAVDPATGSIGPSIPIGDIGASLQNAGPPGSLAMSDDGNTLYVAVNNRTTVQRVDLVAGTVATPVTLAADPIVGPGAVGALAVLPGAPGSFALARVDIALDAGVHIYDDGVARPGIGARRVTSLQFAGTASRLYGLNWIEGPPQFSRMDLDATGVARFDVTASPGFSFDVKYDQGLIFSGNSIIEPETLNVRGSFISGFRLSALIFPDPASNRAYAADSGRVFAFDRNTFALLGSVDIPGLAVAGDVLEMVRWGSNGLALRTGGDRIFLVTDSMIK